VLSRTELSKAINTYPRILSLSPERAGKLCSVLRLLGAGAARVLAVEVAAGTDLSNELNWRPKRGATKGGKRQSKSGDSVERGWSAATAAEESAAQQAQKDRGLGRVPKAAGADDEPGAASTPGGTSSEVAADFKGLDGRGRVSVSVARTSPIRRMLREAIVRYPLILGTGLERTESRLSDFVRLVELSAPVRCVDGVHTTVGRGLRWDAFVQVLRRPEDAHLRWRDAAVVDVETAKRKEKERLIRLKKALIKAKERAKEREKEREDQA